MSTVDGTVRRTTEDNPAEVTVPARPIEYQLNVTEVIAGPASSVITNDTATIDFTGAGTEVSPLTASVVPGSVGPPLPVFDECGDAAQWYQWGGSGTWSIQTVADSAVGGKVIRSNASTALIRSVLVPFDPNVLYRIKFRVRQVTNATGAAPIGGCYAGFEGVAADGVTLVNIDGLNLHTSQHNMACNGTILLAANGWQEFVAYVKGVAAQGTYSPTTPTAPGKMHQSTRYIRPYIQVNYSATDGVAEMDYVSLEVVPNDALIAVGDTAEVDLTNTAGTVTAALRGGSSGNWAVPSGDVAIGDGANAAIRLFYLSRKIGADARQWRMYVHDTGQLSIESLKNGASDAAQPVYVATPLNVGGDLTISNHNLLVAGGPGSGGDAYAFCRFILGRLDVALGVWDSNIRFTRLVNSKRVVVTQIIADEYTPLNWDLNVNDAYQGNFGVVLDQTTGLPFMRLQDKNAVVRPVPFATFAGTVSVTNANGTASSGTGTINFPTSGGNRFTVAPIVVATVIGSTLHVAQIGTVSPTSATVYVREVNSTTGTFTITCHVHAIQMTPTAASG